MAQDWESETLTAEDWENESLTAQDWENDPDIPPDPSAAFDVFMFLFRYWFR